MLTLTRRQARRFLLLRHGLLGDYVYTGKQGVLDYIHRVGSIQFDPVDVCGRSADISLNSRVCGYSKSLLEQLLYTDRLICDSFDKNLCISPVEDRPLLLGEGHAMGGGYAEAYNRKGGEAVKNTEPLVRKLISERGCISAGEIEADKSIKWDLGKMCSLPRATLESMYFRGELIIHHKNGTNKSYALAEDYVPAEILNAPRPYRDESERNAIFVRRRIGAVGLLADRASDAWLGLFLKAEQRLAAFERLTGDGVITAVEVEGIKDLLYLLTDELPILDAAMSETEFKPRCELLAPLDCLLWDRKLIKALFGFEYTWEIYTPAAKRKYGAYVLPILLGEQLIGRTEVVRERGKDRLIIKNIWLEDGVKRTKKLEAALNGCYKRFAGFNGCRLITFSETEKHDV